MPSPLPGMDPFLEGALWPDVHHRLATEISRRLMPQLRPRYVARLELYVLEDSNPEADIGIMYPDVEVVTTGQLRTPRQTSPDPGPGTAAAGGLAPAPLTIPLVAPVSLQVPVVEVRSVPSNTLVTAIEILSPVNKRGDGLAKYREKRQRLHQAGVHLLELDLLRRGTRPLSHPRIPKVPYVISLTRAQASQVELWPLGLAEPLPVVPVPLLAPDADVHLDLAAALSACYDEAAYDLSLDYAAAPPPPELGPADAEWLEAQLRAAGLRPGPRGGA